LGQDLLKQTSSIGCVPGVIGVISEQRIFPQHALYGAVGSIVSGALQDVMVQVLRQSRNCVYSKLRMIGVVDLFSQAAIVACLGLNFFQLPNQKLKTLF